MAKTLPSREEILRFLSESPTPLTKRELARAFNVSGDDRIPFKQLLREMEDSGVIVQQAGKGYAIPDALPEVTVIEVTDIDVDEDTLARPAEWDEDTLGPPPRIEVMPGERGHPALMPGDRVLARLIRLAPDLYQAQVLRRLDTPKGRVIGMVVQTKGGLILKPADKKAKTEFDIPPKDLGKATPGMLVVGEVQPSRGLKRPRVRIVDVIGQHGDPKAISLIALHEVGLRPDFPSLVLSETKDMTVPPLGKREDLRKIPLVTIDGIDARDFDDAVFAEGDTDPGNSGGFHLMVAIADVAHYVRPSSALNVEALRRGNSTYFPDRVVPMLPEALSNDLCSLRPKEDRACLAVHMWIDAHGQMLRYKFVRGLMRSAARLIYEQVQAAYDGMTDDLTDPLMDAVIRPLYAAYKVLSAARIKRGALELDLPERQILLSDSGEMIGVRQRARYDSHKLIEEFMILANVAAARALEDRRSPCVYRIHDRPDAAKLDTAREFVESFGLSLPRGQVTKPAQLNAVLLKAAEHPYSHLISEVLLRTQAQARYSPENIGHFGLALDRYAHFTSPIRRYADLLVHRSLISAYGLGEGGLSDEERVRMEEMSEHISGTERLSAEAERASVDRFVATWLSSRSGAEFSGRISGVTRFGLFIRLEESGADGLVPIRTLPQDFYIHDEQLHALVGRRSGRIYRLGAPVAVRLVEANPLTGGTIFELLGSGGADIPGFSLPMPKGRMGGGGRPSKPHGGGGNPKGGKKKSFTGKKSGHSHKKTPR